MKARRKAVEAPLPTAPGNGADDETWLDVECHKAADPNISLASVQEILSKLPGSLADEVIAERDERG